MLYPRWWRSSFHPRDRWLLVLGLNFSDFKYSGILLIPLGLFPVKNWSAMRLNFWSLYWMTFLAFQEYALELGCKKVWDSLCAKSDLKPRRLWNFSAWFFFNCMKQIWENSQAKEHLCLHTTLSLQRQTPLTACFETVSSNILSQWYGPLRNQF